jgi:hypothetical protein
MGQPTQRRGGREKDNTNDVVVVGASRRGRPTIVDRQADRLLAAENHQTAGAVPHDTRTRTRVCAHN